jgi:septum formation protein
MIKKDRNPSVFLASGSATRAKLLRDAGILFTPCAPVVDESSLREKLYQQRQNATVIAENLSLAKAMVVANDYPQDLVIGSDQLLVFDGVPLGKSVDLVAAKALLQTLRGNTHYLYTAAVLVRGQECLWRHTTICSLTMRDFSDAFLDRYLEQDAAAILSSVGCYRLEERGLQLFDQVEGDYFSILGLPLIDLLKALRNFGAVES